MQGFYDSRGKEGRFLEKPLQYLGFSAIIFVVIRLCFWNKIPHIPVAQSTCPAFLLPFQQFFAIVEGEEKEASR